MLGDCLELYKNIEPKSIDLILTDLPYGTTACKWDTIIPFDKLWEMVNYLLKPNGTFITTASQPFTSALVMSNPKMFKYCWYWNKENAGNFAVAKYMPHKIIEEVLIFCNTKTIYNPIEEEIEKHKIRPLRPAIDRKSDNAQGMASGVFKHRDGYDNTKRYPKNLLTYNSRSAELNSSQRIHPTQKPVALYKWLLMNYAKQGDKILDTHVGSASSLIACYDMGFDYVGFELDEEYWKAAQKRIEENKAQIRMVI